MDNGAWIPVLAEAEILPPDTLAVLLLTNGTNSQICIITQGRTMTGIRHLRSELAEVGMTVDLMYTTDVVVAGLATASASDLAADEDRLSTFISQGVVLMGQDWVDEWRLPAD